MELNHLQFVYDDAQDRLLLRIAATENGATHELRAWLSRRFVSNLWAAVQKALTVQLTLVHPGAMHASAEMIGMAHQSALDALAITGAFGDSFGAALPPHAALAEPFLIVEAKFHVTANEPMRINLLPKDGAGIEIAFDQTELHGFCTLLQQGVHAAGWEQPLLLESAWAGAPSDTDDSALDAARPDSPRLLN